MMKKETSKVELLCVSCLQWENGGPCWWCTPVITALRRLRQQDCEFQVSLYYIGRPYLEKKENKLVIELEM
jgi:hypothetical protein